MPNGTARPMCSALSSRGSSEPLETSAIPYFQRGHRAVVCTCSQNRLSILWSHFGWIAEPRTHRRLRRRAPVRGHAAESARAPGPTWRSRTSAGIGSARRRRAGSACDCPVIESAWWQVAAAAPIAGRSPSSLRPPCPRPYRAPDALRLEIVQVWSHSRQRQNDVTVMTLASVSMILPLQKGHAVGFAAGSLNGDSRIRPRSSPTPGMANGWRLPKGCCRLLDRAAVQE